jgi:hypothetical protein
VERLAAVAILAAALLSGAEAGPRVVAAGSIPADARDAEGETVGGIGSAIEILPSGEIVMLSDRGAGDGTIDYRPRLQFFTMTRNGSKLDLQLVRTVILRDSNGRAFTGLFPDRPSAEPPQRGDGRMCLDPEGLAVGPDGGFFLSEEYLPSVREFTADGRFVRRFDTPPALVPRDGSGKVDFATDDEEALGQGREPNRGFEGLALLPDGRLAAVLQSGAVQDGGRGAGFTRIVVYDTKSGRPAAAYRLPFSDATELDASAPPGKKLKSRHLVCSALAALPDGRLLALERENHGADGSADHAPARWKAVVLLDLRGAENILERAEASSAAPVGRTVLFNLAALDTAAFGLPREEMPAKWEGLAVAGVDDDRLRLLLSSDNDFLAPTLYLRGSDDAPAPVEFPRAERAQDTWILEVETPVPPLSASRNAEPSIRRTT